MSSNQHSKPPGKRVRRNSRVDPKSQDESFQEENSLQRNLSAPSHNYPSTSSLTRRPLRRDADKNQSLPSTQRSTEINISHIPLLVPKKEKPFTQQVILPVSRDPRQTTGPIIEHPDVPENLEEPSTSSLPSEEIPEVPLATQFTLHSEIEIEPVHIKEEPDDGSVPNWKTLYLSDAPPVDEELSLNLNTGSVVRIKTEPVDEEGIFPDTQPARDGENSDESDCTVGLPSPKRKSPSPSPTPPDLTSLNKEPEANIRKIPSYSLPTDVEKEYRQIEKETIKEPAEAGYSHSVANSESSDEEDMPMKSANATLEQPSDDDEIGSMDDNNHRLSDEEGSMGDGSDLSDNERAQKRPLSSTSDELPDLATVPKKSKFTVVKNPAFFAASVPNEVTSSASNSPIPPDANNSISNSPVPIESPVSGNSDSLPSLSPVDPSTSQSANITPSKDDSSRGAKDQTPTKSKIAVKLTTKNRYNNMVEDFLKSANTVAARIPKKKPAPLLKSPSRKRRPTGDNTTAPSPTNLEIPSFDSSSASEPAQDTTQSSNNLSVVPFGTRRDPRMRSKQHLELTHSSKAPTAAELISKLSNTIKTSILIRVLKWQHRWIGEQVKLDEPPPLLQSVKIKHLNLPELSCVPVLSKYWNLQSYYDTFFPLLMHEMWSSITQQHRLAKKEKTTRDWEVLIKSSTKEDVFLLLNCIFGIDSESEAPEVNDLVVFTFTRPTGEKIHPFAFVEKSITTKLVRTADLDRRLLKQKSPKFTVHAVIRILKSYALKQDNIICSVSRVASLTSSMNLFHAQAGLDLSPLRTIVFDPQLHAFQMHTYSQREIGRHLDQTQHTAYYSIAQTMLITPKDVPKVALLQGFPGTGKSHVIVHIIDHILSHMDMNGVRHKILYCAPTNAAVDEMLRRLLKANEKLEMADRYKILRVGDWNRLHPEVASVTLENKLIHFRQRIKHESPYGEKIKELEKKIRTLEEAKKTASEKLVSDETLFDEVTAQTAELDDEIKLSTDLLEEAKTFHANKIAGDVQDFKFQLISHSDVICATLDACNSKDLQEIFVEKKPDRSNNIARPFLCCIIDDASLCTEPETLIPLALGMNKLILVGDVELMSFSLCSTLAKLHNLDQSLFTRFSSFLKLKSEETGSMNPSFTLVNQHRMDSEICLWPSKYYYGTRLLTPENLVFCSPLYSYRVFDVRDSLETVEGTSYVNRPEAEIIFKLVANIMSNPFLKDRSIGIVTFFERQRILIRHILRERMPNDFQRTEVRLVQDYQGTEMDIVIVSCVRTKISPNDNLASMLDHWNIAMTRATESLFICGNLRALQANEVLNDLVTDADKRQVIRPVSSLFPMSLLYDIIHKEIPD